MGVIVRQKVSGKGQPWWVFVAHNGKRTSKQVGDRKAAEKVASEIRARLQLDEFDFEEKKKPSIPLFKDFVEGFMETYSASNHKQSTRDSFRSVLDRHLLPAFGAMPLDTITKQTVKEFIHNRINEGEPANKKGKKLKVNSVRNIKRYLSSMLSEAVDDELISENPALNLRKLINKQEQEEAINPLSWEEKALFEDAIQKHFPKYYPLFLTALRTGLRVGELIALQPGDLDFNGMFIEVRRSFAKGKLTTPKSGKSRRVDMLSMIALIAPPMIAVMEPF